MSSGVHSLLFGTAMHRSTLAGALALACLTLGARAEAQNIMPFVTGVGDDTTIDLSDLATAMGRPIGLPQCDLPIHFRFTGVDPTRTELRFFQGSNCDDVETRTSTTSTACQATDVPPTTIQSRTEVLTDVLVRDLLPCDDGGSAVPTIWVLALSSPTDQVTGAGQKVSFPIAYDFDPPSPPSGLTVSPGESAARLRWTAASGVDRYDIFLDPEGCTDAGEVNSPGLTSDPPDETLIVATAGEGASSATAAYPSGVEFGQYVAVAIRAADNAGNVSELTAPVCVQRIEVVSWWDTVCGGAEGPAYCAGGCGVAPGRPSGAVGFALPLAALALLLRRRWSR